MSLEGIWPPLCMAKTVKLQGRHAALLLYSASCQTQMTSYHSDSCCLVSGTIMSLRLGAVLNFCRSSLTYSANTLAQSYKQEWRVSPTKHFAATAAGCSKPTSPFSGLAGFFSSSSFIRGLSWYTSARLILQHTACVQNYRAQTGKGKNVFTCSWGASAGFWGCNVCGVQPQQMFYPMTFQTLNGAGLWPHSREWMVSLTAAHE